MKIGMCQEEIQNFSSWRVRKRYVLSIQYGPRNEKSTCLRAKLGRSRFLRQISIRGVSVGPIAIEIHQDMLSRVRSLKIILKRSVELSSFTFFNRTSAGMGCNWTHF